MESKKKICQHQVLVNWELVSSILKFVDLFVCFFFKQGVKRVLYSYKIL